MSAGIDIRPMEPADFDAVTELWGRSEGVGLGPSDTRERIGAYLSRNPGLSQVAVSDSRIVGAVLCGHDGRRGLLYHLAVDRAFRDLGIGRRMVEKALSLLREQGIKKTYIMVFDRNAGGRGFWKTVGWENRTDLIPMSFSLE